MFLLQTQIKTYQQEILLPERAKKTIEILSKFLGNPIIFTTHSYIKT